MYANLFEKLISGNVSFLLLGGAAVSLHGFPRMTTDIDILLQNSPENIDRFVAATRQWGNGCSSGISFEEFQGPGCVRIEEDFPLDVFTMLGGKGYEDFVRNAAKYVLAGGIEILCISISDLIDLKKETFSEKDLLVVTVLRRLQTNPQKDLPPTINLDPSSPPPLY